MVDMLKYDESIYIPAPERDEYLNIAKLQIPPKTAK
jgi:hypothetical protein